MAHARVAGHAYRALVGSGGVCLVTIGVLAFTLPHLHGSTVAHAWVWGAVAPLYLVGLLAVIMRPDHLSARWLGAAGALMAIETLGRRLMSLVGDVGIAWWVVGSVGLQVAVLATAAAIASVLVVFPDEHHRYPYQRRVLWVIWLYPVVVPALLLVSTPSLYLPMAGGGPEIANPLFTSARSWLGTAAEGAFHWRVVLWAIGAAAMVVRHHRASPGARRRFGWPLAAAVVLTTLDAASRLVVELDVLPGTGRRLIFFGLIPGMILLSVSILVAVTRHRLMGLDLWLRRTILFGGASAVIALAYLGFAGLVGVAAGSQISLGVGVLVTLVAIVALYPARGRLDAWARRWVFGRSVTGTEVLRRVGDTIEDAHDTSQLGTNLVRTVVDSLELEWARMSLSAEAGGPSCPVAAFGVGEDDPAVPDLVVPLTDGGETFGLFECGPKRAGELTKADEVLLAAVARQAALAVRSVRLASELESRLAELGRQAEELSASRSRLVQAQMVERHRIERNIHDGVQQEIIASIAKIRLARNQLARDPDRAEVTLASLQDHTRRMLENLRELSRGIHPPVLTHHGLVEALRTQAGMLPIDIHVDVAADIRESRFPDEVEEAAYYVASEGLTNVLKHARTGQATVKLGMDGGRLVVAVIDNGCGCDPVTPPGSGLVGLRDRLGSLGGELSIVSKPGDGTTLRAALPTRAAGHHAP